MELKEVPWRDFADFPNNLGLQPNTYKSLRLGAPVLITALPVTDN